MNDQIQREDSDDWQRMWDARRTALEAEFGPAEDMILTAMPPIYLDGGADVLSFKNHLDGVLYVTAGLIGDGRQQTADIGEFELAMCFREENEWAPKLLSQLAPYTFQATLRPLQTMDIAPAMPEGSSIAVLLFDTYHQFKVNDQPASVLLCIGITPEEFERIKADGPSTVLEALKTQGIFPYTDVYRASAAE